MLDTEQNIIQVLDKGYVRLIDVLGSDLSVVDAARVSYDRKSELGPDGRLRDNDMRLINFLWKNNHTSPFRHCAMTFEVYAPLMVARQWWKHHVAATGIDDQNGWNESSRRYVTENEEFYVPAGFRSKPENSKQGSGDLVDSDLSDYYELQLIKLQEDGLQLYRNAMAQGIAPEQARLFLPANGLYVRWRWTVSLHSVLHFLELRKEHTSQWEIQQYAKAVSTIVSSRFPISHRVALAS